MELRRDNQQWVFDWLVEQTGKTYHFAGDSRGELPREVRSHAMISKHLTSRARKLHALAQDEDDAGHAVTALDLWFRSAVAYARAQHPIFENGEEKELLHARSMRCFERVRELAPRRIERIEVPFGDSFVAGNLHLAGNGGGPAPCVFFIPGCDMTKEMFPHPLSNPASLRGMHVFSFDGPGQGESNIRGLRLTASNYEQAVHAAASQLAMHEAVDPQKLVLFGLSFGSHWAMRAAGVSDAPFAAIAAPWSSVCDKRYLMNMDSPRYKQLFAYLTGAESEDELDDFIAESSLEEAPGRVRVPTLLAVGEYDPRSPLKEVVAFFDQLSSERELWIFEDQHHPARVVPFAKSPIWSLDIYDVTLDWLADRLAGRSLGKEAIVRRIAGGRGPSSASNEGARFWYEAP